ncbi:MAG: hypothetical protein EOP06_05775 [Proteobacteria bacterium]|nr:MAG: hypothetical protein EOP06_05775 [Pseudomonadota bacterium]
MKTLALVTTVFFAFSANAMAQQACYIQDGSGENVVEMKVDSTRPKSGVTANWTKFKETYKGYAVEAIFTGPEQEMAIMTAKEATQEISAVGIELVIKKQGVTVLTVQCGN